jgi:hypothetical protein
MNRTFTTMKTNVGNNVMDTSSATATVIGTYLNDVYFDLLRRINWKNVDDDYSFSTVAGTKDYVLPDNFKKELHVYDATNDKELARIDRQILINQYPTTVDDTGVAVRYLIFDSPVQAQPSSSSVLSIVSDNAGDTTQTLYVRGLSGGVEVTESVTLNGTSAQASTTAFTEIISFSKSAATTGKVTITSNSGAVTNAVIAPDIVDYKVKLIRLHPAPSGVATIRVPYIINPQPLLNDYDTPLLDAADVIEQGATAIILRRKRQYAKAQEWERIFEKSVNALIWDLENQPNMVKQFNIKPYSRETV